MKITIDLDKCYRSGECYYNHPQLFQANDAGDLELAVQDVTDDLRQQAEQAADLCPAQAITLED